MTTRSYQFDSSSSMMLVLWVHNTAGSQLGGVDLLGQCSSSVISSLPKFTAAAWGYQMARIITAAALHWPERFTGSSCRVSTSQVHSSSKTGFTAAAAAPQYVAASQNYRSSVIASLPI
jgi:hypothetical protein